MMFYQFNCSGMTTTLLEQITLRKPSLFISVLLSAMKEKVCYIEYDVRKENKSLNLQINTVPFNRNKNKHELCHVKL